MKISAVFGVLCVCLLLAAQVQSSSHTKDLIKGVKPSFGDFLANNPKAAAALKAAFKHAQSHTHKNGQKATGRVSKGASHKGEKSTRKGEAPAHLSAAPRKAPSHGSKGTPKVGQKGSKAGVKPSAHGGKHHHHAHSSKDPSHLGYDPRKPSTHSTKPAPKGHSGPRPSGHPGRPAAPIAKPSGHSARPKPKLPKKTEKQE